jgi:protein-tyrosine phosphatase
MYARRLLTESVSNMRELGGYATRDGGMTQWRRFVRSNFISTVTERETDFLRGYGIRTAIDLRHPEETAMQPSPLSNVAGMGYRNIPFTDDFSLLGDTQYCPLYHLVPVVQGANRIADILRALCEDGGGCLFFCFAGKDRTGVIAALLLLLARVPVEDVIADYQVTYTYIRNAGFVRGSGGDVGKRPLFLQSKDGASPKRPEHLRRTEPEWIQPFIDYVLGFGGAEGYLRSIGLSRDEATRLRERVICP